MKRKKFLSVIIPLFNEESRIFNLIYVYNYLQKKKFDSEIILINDGSRDNTLKEVEKIIFENKLKNTYIFSYTQNKGKGYAIRKGILMASGDYKLFTDIDLSTPIEEFDKFIPFLKTFDLIIGSRKIKGAKIMLHQPNIRERLGKAFTRLSKIILSVEINDFTCGFKCFSKLAAKQIFNIQRINRWGFDSEVLYLAKKIGYRIKEVPVKWSNDPRSRVRFPRDIIISLTDLIRIRYYDSRGDYK